MTTLPKTQLVGGTFLAQLAHDEHQALHGLSVRRTFPRGAVLMFEHEPDERVMLLLAGRVKVTAIRHDRREILLSLRDPGDVLGELAFIDGQPRTATVSALEPVDALVMPAQVFRSYLETTPRVAVVLLEIVARRFREATDQRLQFAASDSMGRLAARIVELADRYGEPGADGIIVDLPISQEELASWTGASRASVAQALQVFRELGWIQTERRRLTVTDAAALRSRSP
ncbi:MAG TPA: Crp/Fnr family transcriptional regulator [Solirubrobacteraceae bacterium]|nr:Crp/Fnr family transcriptional regulator [Solirubrobacteraceae bacterium]